MTMVLLSIFYGIFVLGNFTSGLLGEIFAALKLSYYSFFEGSVASFIWNGLIEGVLAGVTIALPYIIPFYVSLSILEDSGYLARIAFLMDSAMHKIGLHGKGFIPLILGFGCMRLPLLKGGGVDEERAVRQIRYAIDHGVSYVDTAPAYHLGKSEQVLGKALGGGYREKVSIATKLPPWSVRQRADMDRILDSQLRTLRTGRIDYYLLHSLSKASWEKMRKLGVQGFLDTAKKTEGYIMPVSRSMEIRKPSERLSMHILGFSVRSNIIFST
jgi:hypothetical protein